MAIDGKDLPQIYLSENWLLQLSQLVLKLVELGQDYTSNIHLALEEARLKMPIDDCINTVGLNNMYHILL